MSLSFLWLIQSSFSPLIAQEKMGFAHSFSFANNLLGDSYWSNFNSRSSESNEAGTAAEIPLTSTIQTPKRPKLDFDPILHLFQMEQESTDRIDASTLVCSLEEPASFRAFPKHSSPFSNISIQAAITWEQFPHADSFLIDCAEDVTLMLGGSFTGAQVPEWLAVWNKLVFNFHQPGRGECQFYFQHFGKGIIILGNNSIQARQKIYLVLMEKSQDSPHPSINTHLLEPLKSSISVKFQIEKAGPCSIQITDFNEKYVRTLEHKAHSQVGENVAEFWDGCNDAGMTVANGIYFYKIFAETETRVPDKKLKMVVLR